MSGEGVGRSGNDWLNDPDFIDFVRWDCLPRSEKEKEDVATTVTEKADEIGVTRKTLQRWRKKDEYAEIKDDFIQEHLRGADARALRAMDRVAQKEDPKAHKDRENLLTILGYAPNQATVRHEGQVTHTMEDARVMDTDSLRRHAKTQLKNKPEMKDLPDAAVDGAVEALLDVVGAPKSAVEEAESAGEVRDAEQLPSGEEYVLSAGEDPEDWTQTTQNE